MTRVGYPMEHSVSGAVGDGDALDRERCCVGQFRSSGGISGYWRLERRLGHTFWQLHSGWRAAGGEQKRQGQNGPSIPKGAGPPPSASLGTGWGGRQDGGCVRHQCS